MRNQVICWLIFGTIIFFSSANLFAQTDDQSYGFVQFDFNLDEIFIIIDDDLVNARKYDPEEVVKLKTGTRKITVVNKDINDFNYKLDIYPDSTIVSEFNIRSFTRRPKSSYNVLNEQRNVIINTEPEGQIYFNDELVGIGTYADILPIGKQKIEVVHPEYGSLRISLKPSQYRIQEISRYNQNFNPPNIFQRILPGGSYLANKQKYKAAITYASLGVLGYLAYDLNQSYNNLNDSFEINQFNYLNAQSILEADIYRNAANEDLDNMDSKNTQLKSTLIGIGAVYLITTLEGLRKPRDGYKASPRTDTRISLTSSNFVQNTPLLTFSINF